MNKKKKIEEWQILGIWFVMLLLLALNSMFLCKYAKADDENFVLKHEADSLNAVIEDQQFLLNQYADYRTDTTLTEED